MPDYKRAMFPGDYLAPNERLYSSDSGYCLMLLPTEALTIFHASMQMKEIWTAPDSLGCTPLRFTLDAGGNAVLYDTAGQQHFQTYTYYPNRKGTSLVMQDDGHLVLYGIAPLFSSVDNHPIAPPAATSAGVDLRSVISTAVDVVDIVLSLL